MQSYPVIKIIIGKARKCFYRQATIETDEQLPGFDNYYLESLQGVDKVTAEVHQHA